MTTTSKLSPLRVFIDDGHIELLRLMPKSSGFVAYLPSSVARALNLSEDDRSLVAFIDDSSSYTMLIILKDSTLSNLLKPVILARRQKAQQLQQELKQQLQAQQQQATEAEQEYGVDR